MNSLTTLYSLMNKKSPLRTILPVLLAVAIGSITPAPAAAVRVPDAPAIPQRLINQAQESGHPFLHGTLDWIRDLRRQVKRDPLEDRAERLMHRVENYMNDESSWYIGEGPFLPDSDFQPQYLANDEFHVYSQLVLETMVANSLNPNRQRINRLETEFFRLLDELAYDARVREGGLTEAPFGRRFMEMLTLATLIYDGIYQRIDIVDRHAPNAQIKQARDALAQRALESNSGAMTPLEQIHLGAALGTSTLFCIAIYPQEWRGAGNGSSLMPDLYRAVVMTRKGLNRLVTPSGELAAPLEPIGHALNLLLPWSLSMQQMGYAHVLPVNALPDLVRALEPHRLPLTPQIIEPHDQNPKHSPWVPPLRRIYPEAGEDFYYEIVNPLESAIAQHRAALEGGNQGNATSRPAPAQSAPPSQAGVNLQGQPVRFQRNVEEPLSIREQLQRYMLGGPDQTQPTDPQPTPIREPKPDAGWQNQSDLPLPTIWGTVYRLAQTSNPNFPAKALWEEMEIENDSHAYRLLFAQSAVDPGWQEKPRDVFLLDYPSLRCQVSSSKDLREPFLIATQSAAASVITPTLSIAHESFLLSENLSTWRWIHEAEPQPQRAAAREGIAAITPLQSSLYTVWQTDSPMGKTLVARRHHPGIGGYYTVVAHYPDSATRGRPPIRYLNIQRPENSQLVREETIRDWMMMSPAGTGSEEQELTLQQYQQRRRMERMGMAEQTSQHDLHMVFSPEVVDEIRPATGKIGPVAQISLRHEGNPFFYILKQDMPGQEMFELKYPTLPMTGMRILEWRNGAEWIAVKQGEEIKNPFIESDAELVIISHDETMDGTFYLMVNGSYLRVKFSPQQSEFEELISGAQEPFSVAWAQRTLVADRHPPKGSILLAPKVLAFESPQSMVKYGRKGLHAVVHEPDPSR